MPELPVSVSTAAEAESALASGAGLIDVKEPERGSLGRADANIIRAVIRQVAGRRAVSAALGEWQATPIPFHGTGLCFAKWGLSGCGNDPTWPEQLRLAAGRLAETAPGCRPVAVAYADAARAAAPPVREVAAFAKQVGWDVLLMDTWHKDGSTLLDWLPYSEVAAVVRDCRQAGVRVALAGSLGLKQIQQLALLAPDWFAVRTAACREGRRDQPICSERVRRLVEAIEDTEAPRPEHLASSE
jgi:uncharacterized protein (UPF0264 family)